MHCYGAFMTSHLKIAVNPLESTDLQPSALCHECNLQYGT